MQHWLRKFRNAFRGVIAGARGQTSFLVHFPIAIAVLAAAAWLQCELWQWACLMLCIGIVLTAEWFNSALELLARANFQDHNKLVGDALDSASAAVLIASITAAIVGIVILLSQFIETYFQ